MINDFNPSQMLKSPHISKLYPCLTRFSEFLGFVLRLADLPLNGSAHEFDKGVLSISIFQTVSRSNFKYIGCGLVQVLQLPRMREHIDICFHHRCSVTPCGGARQLNR
jgi:hypothetical protein